MNKWRSLFLASFLLAIGGGAAGAAIGGDASGANMSAGANPLNPYGAKIPNFAMNGPNIVQHPCAATCSGNYGIQAYDQKSATCTCMTGKVLSTRQK